jgi:hypothetical protein
VPSLTASLHAAVRVEGAQSANHPEQPGGLMEDLIAVAVVLALAVLASAWLVLVERA